LAEESGWNMQLLPNRNSLYLLDFSQAFLFYFISFSQKNPAMEKNHSRKLALRIDDFRRFQHL